MNPQDAKTHLTFCELLKAKKDLEDATIKFAGGIIDREGRYIGPYGQKFWDEECRVAYVPLHGSSDGYNEDRAWIPNDRGSWILNWVVDFVETNKDEPEFGNARMFFAMMRGVFLVNTSTEYRGLTFIHVDQPKYRVPYTAEVFAKIEEYSKILPAVRYVYDMYRYNYVPVVEAIIAKHLRVQELERRVENLTYETPKVHHAKELKDAIEDNDCVVHKIKHLLLSL